MVGIENDMRAASSGPRPRPRRSPPSSRAAHPEFHHDRARHPRRRRASSGSSPSTRARIEVVVHTAAQPSHDWAAREPQTDFTRQRERDPQPARGRARPRPDAPFIFCSTNKVYGDTPNRLPLEELETRLELPESHRYFAGIDTSMSIDHSTHSLFGVSKAAADLLVQEYGRYFEMPTVCFRGGCLTGPAARRRASCTASSPT